MTPTKFEGSNVVFAEDQPEYQPLPALRIKNTQGEILTCWRMTWRERFKLLLTGRVWLSVWTFGNPLQPMMIHADQPFKIKPQTIENQTT